VSVQDVSAQDFIAAYARFLKRSGRIDVPKWADIVKTGAFKELPPQDADWFFVRVAAIARRIYIKGGLGTGAFKKIFGGSRRNGSRPSHFATASGSVIRAALHQLEKLKIIEKNPNGGRRVTSIGRRDLDRIASQVVTGRRRVASRQEKKEKK